MYTGLLCIHTTALQVSANDLGYYENYPTSAVMSSSCGTTKGTLTLKVSTAPVCNVTAYYLAIGM